VREHRPYGEQALGTPKDGPGFTGHMGDADTGLVYMQQRYYDPGIGRFLSVDPVAANSGAGFNRYSYANNNPYRFIDPDGRAACPGQSKTACIESSTKISVLKTQVDTTQKINQSIVSSAPQVGNTKEGPEKAVFIVAGKDGELTAVQPANSTTSTGVSKSQGSFTPPAGVTPVAINHGHINEGVNKSQGLASSGDGRAAVEAGYPVGVVSHGNVAVVTAPGGRLRIQILQGSIARENMKPLQLYLDQQQRALVEEGK
jgi:RHS repeat-associated protein